MERLKKLVVSVPNKSLSPFSPYRLHYYCSSCGRWILKEKAHFNSTGQPICPFCHRPLRLGPKNRKRRQGR